MHEWYISIDNILQLQAVPLTQRLMAYKCLGTSRLSRECYKNDGPNERDTDDIQTSYHIFQFLKVNF